MVKINRKIRNNIENCELLFLKNVEKVIEYYIKNVIKI